LARLRGFALEGGVPFLDPGLDELPKFRRTDLQGRDGVEPAERPFQGLDFPLVIGCSVNRVETCWCASLSRGKKSDWLGKYATIGTDPASFAARIIEISSSRI